MSAASVAAARRVDFASDAFSPHRGVIYARSYLWHCLRHVLYDVLSGWPYYEWGALLCCRSHPDPWCWGVPGIGQL